MSSLSTLRSVVRTLGRVSLKPIIYLAAILLLPLLAGGINLGIKFNALGQVRAVPTLSQRLPAPSAYDPTKKIAVVLASNHGAVVTDFLPTYDILSRSGRFNVYVVAPERQTFPLLGFASTGINIVPDFSFAGYKAAFGRPPDLIAVPYLPGYTPTRDAAILAWLRANSGPRTTVLGICAGTAVVADSGLLDGHRATTNTNWFATVEKQHPTVRWTHNVRYVDDGPVVTSTNLAAGMDATLHVVDRFAGRAVAVAVARQIGYPTLRYLDDPRWQLSSEYNAPLVPIAVNAAFRWGWEKVGLVLHNGVDELSVAAWADTHGIAAEVYTVAPTSAPIRSQHGLYFVPDYAEKSAPQFDRLLVADGGAGKWAYTASLRDLARDQGDAAATAYARVLFLPTTPGQSSTNFSLAPLISVLALSMLGASLVYGLGRIRWHLIGQAARASRLGRLARGVARFVLHFIEMAIVMEVGMMALGTLNAQVLVPLVHIDLTGPTLETHVVAMGVFMAAPMAAWMGLRGHGWDNAWEMAAAMLAPFVGSVVLCYVGLVPRADMMTVGSSLMWVAMVGLMLFRWRHYAGAHDGHRTPVAAPTRLAALR